MDVAASEFYKEDKAYDLNFKEEVSSLLFSLLLQTVFDLESDRKPDI